MQDAYVGSWAQESHLSTERLESLRDLNHRFLDLTAARANEWLPRAEAGFEPSLTAQVVPLSTAQRAAAAACPYALFDLRFHDEEYWRLRLQNSASWRVADESAVDEATVGFVRLALFYAWHV